MTSQQLIVIGLTFDVLGVLLVAAGLLSGRKHRILNRIESLKNNEEFRERTISGYEEIRETLLRNHDNEAIDCVGSVDTVNERIDEWQDDVNRGMEKVSNNISEDLEKLKVDLESYQLVKEKAGVACLVLGFILQILGTTNAVN